MRDHGSLSIIGVGTGAVANHVEVLKLFESAGSGARQGLCVSKTGGGTREDGKISRCCSIKTACEDQKDSRPGTNRTTFYQKCRSRMRHR